MLGSDNGYLMAPQRPPAFPCEPEASRNSTTHGQGGGSELDSKLQAHLRPGPPAQDFLSFVSKIVERARVSTGASGSAIAFRGEHGTVCQVRSGEGAPELGAPVDTTSGLTKQCLDSGTSLLCNDIANDSRVDPEIVHAVGIRSVAVVPIYKEGEISGILEVFSRTAGKFTGEHLKILEQLASSVGSASRTPREKPVSDPNRNVHADITLLLESEPAYRVFFRNLIDLAASPRSTTSSKSNNAWTDVLVDSRLPWKGFVESVVLHLAIAGMLFGLSRIWPHELIVSPRPIRAEDVTYYPPQSFPARQSYRPPALAKQKSLSAGHEIAKALRDARMPAAASPDHTDSRLRLPALAAPVPPALAIAGSGLQRPNLGVSTSILPSPPVVGAGGTRRSQLPGLPAVAPAPAVSGSPGSRKLNSLAAAVVPPSPDLASSTMGGRNRSGDVGPGSSTTAVVSIVPPPPSINDHPALGYGARGGSSRREVQVVAPPPALQGRGNLRTSSAALSSEGGGSQIVPPPPSLDGSAGARTGSAAGAGRTNSIAGGAQVVPPPPALQAAANGGGRQFANPGYAGSQVVAPPPSLPGAVGGTSMGSVREHSVPSGVSQVVPPPPSVGNNEKFGQQGRGTSVASASGDAALPPTSTTTSPMGDLNASGDRSIPAIPLAGADRTPPTIQDVQLRVITAAWAPPRSSYFSNYEVFIAEKWVSKQESQLIKLVYVFLPYQRRMTDYGLDTSKVRKLRVTRDPTCDESLMQLEWPEGEKKPAQPGDAPTPNPGDRNNLLPCYRTTADDYRKAFSRN